MQIGDLAKRGGVSVQTVRYYERYGLLDKPERKPSRYRIYGEEDVKRLRFILHSKTLGFTLDEIKQILALRKKQSCPCGEVRRIGEERLKELENQIQQLTAFHHELARAVQQWQQVPDEAPAGDAICILIERTMNQARDGSGPAERNKNRWHLKKVKSTNVRNRNAAARSR